MVENSKESSIIKDLYVSITNGESKLVVGFYLDGPLISHRKRWFFGDNKEGEINNNLVYNHTYEKPGTYHMYVEILDNLEVTATSKPIDIVVGEKTPALTLQQWEGVIYEGDSVGFSLATTIPDNPTIKWIWGDGKSNTSEDSEFYRHRLKPHHKFENAQTCLGNVTVEGKEKTEKKFGVLILPDQLKNVTGYIDVNSIYRRNDADEFPVNKELTIQAQLTGGTPPYSTIWTIDNWNEGSDIILKHIFKETGSHHVICTIRDKFGLKLILDKTIVIV